VSKLELPSTMCRGFDMPDGTKYNACGSGYVQVDNPIHEAMIRANVGLRFLDQFGGHSPAVAEIVCHCRFVAYAWQAGQPCPRCGEPLPEVQDAAK